MMMKQIKKKARTARKLLMFLVILIVPMLSLGATPVNFIGNDDDAPIDPLVNEQLAENGQADIFVKMSSDADLSSLDTVSNRKLRLRLAYRMLTKHADASQSELRLFLKDRNIHHRVFWINNSLFIEGAKPALVAAIASRDDIAYIRGNHQVPLIRPVAEFGSEGSIDAIEWNISQINAPDVWSMGYTGSGVVVANIDTGVRYTHQALVGSYRGNLGSGSYDHEYNWWDPNMNLASPSDLSGHGTHTMGTMVGGDGFGGFSEDIGVAPDAQWIAAKGCGSIFCSDVNLISSAQWIACPTKLDGTAPDCSKAPHIVNNSWGGGGGDAWYTSYVNSWLAAGIVPVFSAGNSGPECLTMGSPGDYKFAIGVGATDSNEVLANFSSKGPGFFRLLKPDFVAPGEGIRSSIGSGDSAYAVFSGTSMAAPHVSGTLALLLSADPGAGILDLYQALSSTAVQSLGTPPEPTSCGGHAYDVYPNAIYGWGRIDALAGVSALP